MTAESKMILTKAFFRTYAPQLLVAIALTAMVACGGGGSTSASLPGTGGTGITASGPIEGFGSVIVNGIKFDETVARVTIDGETQGVDQLRLGMTAQVEGNKSSAPVTPTVLVKAQGEAKSIEVWSIAQGSVTQVLSSSSFIVSGMTMVVDSGSVLVGAASVGNLAGNRQVKIWGQPADSDFAVWSVTRLEVLNDVVNTVTTGKVSLRFGVASLNGYVLSGNTTAIKDGQLVRATGTVSTAPSNTLTLVKLTTLADSPSAYPSTGLAELQGIVTSVLGTSTTTPSKVTRIAVGTAVVDTSNAAVHPMDASLSAGVRVEVEGRWSNGVLIADHFEIKSSQQLQEVEMEAVIEQFTSVSNFFVRGQRCDASGLTRVGNGSLSSLRTGLRVHLHGLKSGDTVRITELEIK